MGENQERRGKNFGRKNLGFFRNWGKNGNLEKSRERKKYLESDKNIY